MNAFVIAGLVKRQGDYGGKIQEAGSREKETEKNRSVSAATRNLVKKYARPTKEKSNTWKCNFLTLKRKKESSQVGMDKEIKHLRKFQRSLTQNLTSSFSEHQTVARRRFWYETDANEAVPTSASRGPSRDAGRLRSRSHSAPSITYIPLSRETPDRNQSNARPKSILSSRITLPHIVPVRKEQF